MKSSNNSDNMPIDNLPDIEEPTYSANRIIRESRDPNSIKKEQRLKTISAVLNLIRRQK